MKCPKCGRKLRQDGTHVYCLFCGYMDNGNVITKKKTIAKASDLEIFLGNRYDTLFRNENTVAIFFLGPIYFSYCKIIWLTVIAFIIELLFYGLMLFSFPVYYIFTIFFSFIFMRVVYMAVSNQLCLKIYQKRIDKWKKKLGADYLPTLREKGEHYTSIVDILIACEILALILFIIFFYILPFLNN